MGVLWLVEPARRKRCRRSNSSVWAGLRRIRAKRKKCRGKDSSTSQWSDGKRAGIILFLLFGRKSEQIELNERIAWLKNSECEDMSSGGVLNCCCNLRQSSWCQAGRSTWEMLSLLFLLFGQKSEQLGLNGKNGLVSGHE